MPIREDLPEQQRIAALIAQARDGDAQFQVRLETAGRMVAQTSGAPIGSEAWVQAQQALSRAESVRSLVSQSLADLDTLQIAAAQKSTGPEALAMLENAVGEVAAMDVREDQALQSLRERLSVP